MSCRLTDEQISRALLLEKTTLIINKWGKRIECPTKKMGFSCYEFNLPSPVFWHATIYEQRYISLALFQIESPLLEVYSNKVPIMVINGNTLKLTIDCFEISEPHQATSNKSAIDYLLIYNTSRLDLTLEPNERFSTFLHYLQEPLSLQYVLQLGKHFNFIVDYILNEDKIKRCVPPQLCFLETNCKGFITVAVRNNHWCAIVSKTPQLNFDVD